MFSILVESERAILSHTVGKRVNIVLRGRSVRHEEIISRTPKQLTIQKIHRFIAANGTQMPEYWKMCMEKRTEILNAVSKSRKMRPNARKNACIAKKVK